MTTNPYPQSAKIIQFPVRGRASVAASHDETKPAAKLFSPRAVRAASGSGWYHDNAILDAERAGTK